MPDWVRYVRERLPISDFKTDRARDTVEELASQLEEVYRTALAQGSTEDEAVAETRDHITNWDKLADDISRAAPSARVGPVPRLADNADANARRRGRAVWPSGQKGGKPWGGELTPRGDALPRRVVIRWMAQPLGLLCGR